MAMKDPEHIIVDDQEYVLGSLDTFSAMHAARAVAPIMPVIFHQYFSDVSDLIRASRDEGSASVDEKLNDFARLILFCEPILEKIAAMPDDRYENIIRTLLKCVERKTATGYAKVMTDGGLMFQDISMVTLQILAFRVLVREFRPIIAALGL